MTNKLHPRTFLLSGALLLAVASLASAATPANLARSDAGARLALFSSSNTGDGTVRAAQALLSDADPLGCSLAAGTTTVLLSLPQAEMLRRFEFLNLTAAGRVSVAVSSVALPAESPRWRSVPAAGRAFNTPDEMVTCELGHADARYLKITFETQAMGRIDTFEVFGADASETAITDRPRFIAYGSVENGGPSGESANKGGARVIHVSSGSGGAEHIVDGSLGTNYAFARGDRRPSTVIDLGKPRSFRQVNIACRTSGAGRLDVYALDRREDADGPLPPAGRQPLGSIPVAGRDGLTRISLPLRAANVRYLAVVFVAGVTDVDGKDSRDYKDSNSGRNASRGNGFADGRRSSVAGDRSGNGPDGSLSGTGQDGNSSTGFSTRGPNGATGSNSQYGASPDGQSVLGGGRPGADGGSSFASGAGAASGGFVLTEVSIGSGGFGNFGGFGGGPGNVNGNGGDNGSNLAQNGGGSTGSNGSAFNFSGNGSGGSGGAGGGSPLTLVPSLPPLVGGSVITP